MKAVILAGGLGSRLSEETFLKPKPMIEIGGRPILWHIMKIYSAHGVNDFIICCGYKGHLIKEYFHNYAMYMSDVTFDMEQNKTISHHKRAEPWKVTLVDTGSESMTGGRLKRVSEYIKEEEYFCFTYGDGVCDIDVTALIAFHKSHNKKATITTSYPPGRFGAMKIEKKRVLSFREKPKGDGARVNAGFFVLSPDVLDFIDDDNTIWEQDPLNKLVTEEELMAYHHDGFWRPMDTLADKNILQEMWREDKAPWKIW